MPVSVEPWDRAIAWDALGARLQLLLNISAGE
jgi:hypothetical protein